MRGFSKKKLWTMILMTTVLLIGVSYAYWSAAVGHTNELKADTMTASIQETFTQNSTPIGTVNKTAAFKNDGSAAAFLRISYIESWSKMQNGSEILLNNTITDDTGKTKYVADKEWTSGFLNSNLWQDGGDGWFYYRKILAPGESTDDIIKAVTFPNKYEGVYANYDGANYQLYFRMELLQASDSTATINSSEVNKVASKAVFGKEAQVSADGIVTWQ